MMIEKAKKRRTLILLILALLGTLLISASLSGLQLHAGLPFPSSDSEANAPEYQKNFYQPEPNFWNVPPYLLKIFPVLILSLLVYAMFRQGEIRGLVFGVLVLSLLIWLIAVVFNWLISVFGGSEKTVGGSSNPPQETTSYSFQQGPIGDAPAIFVWLVIIGLIFLVIAVSYRLYRTSKSTSTKEIIKAEAKKALIELQEGEELSNVVIRCYLQMAQAIKTERGIERDDSMTTQEFERVLVTHNFPEKAIHDLTTLFEKVRYGRKPIDSNDEHTAVDCLKAITGNLGGIGDGTW